MVCYSPLSAWVSLKPRPDTGKKLILFSPPSLAEKGKFEFSELPCGHCIGCRLKYSREWALRCVHESKLHTQNCFITLTYNDENIPYNAKADDFTLVKKHMQDFMKRLRRKIEPAQVRFYGCGEYGELHHRPHYHIILFGYDFEDKIFFKKRGSYNTFISPTLSKLWKYGHHLIADVSFDSCAYVARYVLKKINGEMADEHYRGIQPEFVNMSRRPGIGKDFYNLYKDDIYSYDECILLSNGKTRKLKPPRYYDKLFDVENPKKMEDIKLSRKIQAKKGSDVDEFGHIHDERLKQKEAYTKAKINSLKRSL